MAKRKTEKPAVVEAKTPRRGPRYPKEEYARRAVEWYETIKPKLKASDHGKYLSLDIESGKYEIHKDSMTATDRLWTRLGDPQPFLFRIGYRAAVKIGGHSLRGLP